MTRSPYTSSASATTPPAEIEPKITSNNERFMEVHMICVRITPLAPTREPAMMSSGLSSTNPAVDAASPEKAFSRAITTGMSAPPMATVPRMPRSAPAPTRSQNQPVSAGLTTTITAAATATTARTARSTPCPRKPLSDNTSWSLAKATSEPVRVTTPMSAVIAAAIANWLSTRPSSTTARNDAPATSTDAPPPNPLNRATSCGMPVICTRTARTAPMAEPTTSPASSTRKSTIDRSSSVARMATSIPEAPSRFPRGAVRGRASPLRPRMNRTAATR